MATILEALIMMAVMVGMYYLLFIIFAARFTGKGVNLRFENKVKFKTFFATLLVISAFIILALIHRFFVNYGYLAWS